jgi:nucleoid-associated protein YgaU
MFPTKTDKARDELQGGQRTLSQRERALLLMADGRRSLTDFSPLFSNRVEAEQAIQALVQRGYLQAPQAAAAAPAPAPAAPPARPAPIAAAEPIQVATTSADTFDGKRSLATTRMFLFDICERMFVRRDPKFALQMRDALREARDREAMLTIAALMLTEIEKTAGVERAESLRERIDKLLPPAEIIH